MKMDSKRYTVERDNGIPLTFCGQLIARASSGPDGGKETHKQRWTILKLYKTVHGQYVCVQVGRSQVPGEVDRTKAVVCQTHKEVAAFFGIGPLAKKLYRDVDKANAVRIA